MAKWIYHIESGASLREAINDGNIEQIIYHLSQCYHELLDMLSEEDREWQGYEIEDAIDLLDNIDEDELMWYDTEEIDCWLSEFYNLCDDLRAWVALN